MTISGSLCRFTRMRSTVVDLEGPSRTTRCCTIAAYRFWKLDASLAASSSAESTKASDQAPTPARTSSNGVQSPRLEMKRSPREASLIKACFAGVIDRPASVTSR